MFKQFLYLEDKSLYIPRFQAYISGHIVRKRFYSGQRQQTAFG